MLKLEATDGAADDYFGASVAVSGYLAAVGVTHDDDGGDRSGSAYLFDLRNGEQLYKFTAGDASSDDAFGSAIDIWNGNIVVGAYVEDSGGINSGSAYVYKNIPEPAAWSIVVLVTGITSLSRRYDHVSCGHRVA